MSDYVLHCDRCENVYLKSEESGQDVGMCPDCQKERQRIRDESEKEWERNRPTHKMNCYLCGGKGRVYGKNNSVKCPDCNGSGRKIWQESWKDALKSGNVRLPSGYD